MCSTGLSFTVEYCGGILRGVFLGVNYSHFGGSGSNKSKEVQNGKRVLVVT